MPKLKPSEKDELIRLTAGIIQKYMTQNEFTDAKVATRMCMPRRTFADKRNNPWKFSWWEFQRLSKVLRFTEDDRKLLFPGL